MKQDRFINSFIDVLLFTCHYQLELLKMILTWTRGHKLSVSVFLPQGFEL